MTKVQYVDKELPERAKVAKKAAQFNPSQDTYKLSTLNLGEALKVTGKTARDMRGSIATAKRTYGAKFVSETAYSRNGNPQAILWRVK